MNDEPDDISRWAEGLAPDGDPGALSQRMREYLGDRGYEKAVEQNDIVSTLYIEKQRLFNNILSLVVVYGVLFVLVGLVAAGTLLIKIVF